MSEIKITISGCTKTGKTTITKLIYETLVKNGLNVTILNEILEKITLEQMEELLGILANDDEFNIKIRTKTELEVNGG